MARGMNHCTFIGNVGADPELRYTQSGVAVCNFNIACTEIWTKDGQRQERTEWVRCVAWRALAEIASEHLRKGKQVYVAGKLQTREYEDRAGVTRKAAEVVLSDMTMLGSRDDADDPNRDAAHPQPGNQDAGMTDDDIPF